MMRNCVEEYLTADKAAAILDVTPQMIRKLCRGGELPFYKVGRCIRIARPDFERYLDGQMVGVQIKAKNRKQLTVAQGKRAC